MDRESADWALAYQRAVALAASQAGFLGRSSHELRAPFNHIISLHQLILEGLCEDPEEERLFLRQAFEATQQVLRHLDGLIALSKLEIGETEPILLPLPLRDVVLEVEQLTAMVVKNRNTRLTVVAPAEPLLVESDRDWLRQALMLLIEGAIAAGSQSLRLQWQAPDGGSVALVLQTDSAPERWRTAPGYELPTLTAIAALPLTEKVPQPLSPGFRWRLCERILAALGGKMLETAPDPTTPTLSGQGFELVLPRFLEAPGS